MRLSEDKIKELIDEAIKARKMLIHLTHILK